MRELLLPVNIELANIIIVWLARALGIKGDVSVFREIVGDLNGGGRIGHSGVTATHTVGTAVVAIIGCFCNDPRMFGILTERVLAEVAGFEVDDVGDNDDTARGGETHRVAPRTGSHGTAELTDPHIVGGDGVEYGQREVCGTGTHKLG